MLKGTAVVFERSQLSCERGLCWFAVEETFDGLWATCVQHEIDHLEGKLFIDYLSALKRQLITRKMVKLKRDRARDAF